MNNQLIQKVITSSNLTCPEFIFENPLLDKNVANARSKSFVKILNLSQQNSKINNNLRTSILENIRKMCETEPKNHIKVDENVTTFLLEAYEEKIKNSNIEFSDATDKVLDEYLIQNMKDMTIDSSFKTTQNPDILQPFINLNENSMHLNTACEDIIHWNSVNNNNVQILKDLFLNGNFMIDNISFKLKSEIEKELIEICHSILIETECNVEDIFDSNISLKSIILRSSNSAYCFQTCCHILNYILIMTNFVTKLHTFVQMFVQNVKQNCPHVTFSVLYPNQLSNIALLLDIEIEKLPPSVVKPYITKAIEYLSKLQSESDLIMLLSHFPIWFEIYFNREMTK